MAPTSLPSGRSLAKPPSSTTRTVQNLQPIIKKPQAFSRRRQSIEWLAVLSKRKQALELENKLESGLSIAAGRITSLTKNIMARQTNPQLMKDRQFMSYITRLQVVSEELKSQLITMGKCSKMSSEQDHKRFDSSYQRTLDLWREYRRVSGCVAQHAKIRAQSRKENGSATDDSSSSNVLSNSAAEDAQRTADDSVMQ